MTISAEDLQKMHFMDINITSEILGMSLYINMPKIKYYPNLTCEQNSGLSLAFGFSLVHKSLGRPPIMPPEVIYVLLIKP
ncbi:MAG: hypothetical protein AABZ42_05380, partial [Thermoproteota archaeon]